LGVDGKIPNQYYSSLVITDVFVVADIAARDALSQIEEGDVVKVLDGGAGLPRTYIYGGSSWIEIESGSDVDTVNGYTGTVVLATSDIAEGGLTNLYYTPTRQAAIEAYADQAEADAITSANAYTDGEVATLEAEDLTFLKLDGSRPMTGNLDMGNLNIENLALPSLASHAATKAYVDDSITALSIGSYATTAYVDGEVATLEAEDLTFLKLDGSRPMAGNLIPDGMKTRDLGSVTAAFQYIHGQVFRDPEAGGTWINLGNGTLLDDSVVTSVDFKLRKLKVGGVDMVDWSTADFLVLDAGVKIEMNKEVDLNSNKIVGLATPTASADAATKGYVDGQMDLITVQQLVHETKTLGAGDLSSITVTHSIQGQPWIQVGRVSLVPGDDFTVSGNTITWAGEVATGGLEALESGDKVSIFYMRSVTPFV
jgi:hypothetical protein